MGRDRAQCSVLVHETCVNKRKQSHGMRVIVRECGIVDTVTSRSLRCSAFPREHPLTRNIVQIGDLLLSTRILEMLNTLAASVMFKGFYAPHNLLSALLFSHLKFFRPRFPVISQYTRSASFLVADFNRI